MYFLGRNFNRFFLHWSHDVRNIFYHLLTYRIHKEANQLRLSPSDTDILQRYEDQMALLESERQEYERARIRQMNVALDKELYKKMRVKIYEKMKKNRPESSYKDK